MLKTPGGRPPRPRSHAKYARRLVAALTVPVLLFTAAACGSDDDDKDAAVAKVSGEFGKKPKISVPKDAEPASKAVVSTITEGDGAKVVKGDFVRMDSALESMKDGKNLGDSWATSTDKKAPRQQIIQQMGQPGVLPSAVADAVVGKKVGSRVSVEGTAEALVGNLGPDAAIKPTDGLVWVLDVVGASKVEKEAEAKGEPAKPGEGMPKVEIASKKAAKITIPKGVKAPKELKQQVLSKGDGPKVEAGDGLIAQYTGVKWEDGEKFDSSWDHGGATSFQIGTGAVVEGWDKALVGKRVGDRVLIVIPPEMGYANNPQSGLDKNTLVFSVDIVGKV
ncbi:FKBP-type peptidyl-prolyl cis-trans isomerase [Streptomyces sp. TP-A0874]|uniref:FKBP-type peptidyl-prolyl cis-trans isomerase n=1 Tax=Streptomyces sp. TP-A0874 TaxID=549819 RepID=UPI000AF4F18B|nr:FKBP-type peptidyl-prolyl cis-trans isomerase [Streptomyces sp. TP-A0874]